MDFYSLRVRYNNNIYFLLVWLFTYRYAHIGERKTFIFRTLALSFFWILFGLLFLALWVALIVLVNYSEVDGPFTATPGTVRFKYFEGYLNAVKLQPGEVVSIAFFVLIVITVSWDMLMRSGADIFERCCSCLKRK